MLQLNLRIPKLQDAREAAQQAYATCPTADLQTLLAFAMELVAAHERQIPGTVVVFRSVQVEDLSAFLRAVE